jgi:predicted lipoprotein with Yx(FWY)xxD motif
MRRSLICLLPALAASLTIAACGGGSSSTSSSVKSSAATTPATTPATQSAATSASSSAVVKTASNATLGATVLTDASGMTLYALSGERAGKFICSSAACVQVWHPVTASGTSAPSGVAGLATVKRPDGSEQVAYKGMPLYTFASDQQPGDAKGQGLKDVGTWGAVTVGGAASSAATPAAAPESSPETTPAKSGGGYAY